MRLFLVRHGQTPCNVAEIWHGWDDCSLTEAGQAQALAAGQRLASEPIDVVYSSDIRRARQTAEAIAQPHGLIPILDAGLRERNAGAFEGVPVVDIVAERPTLWEERSADFWGWSPPGGETFHQLLARGMAVIDRLVEQHPEHTVVAVSHMGMNRALISHLARIPIEETFAIPFPSTGVSVFRFDGSTPQVEVLNDAGHLA